jgi:hypothetical protein
MPGVVETTDTFTTNQVITSTLMNDIIDQTLFTSDAIVFGNSTLALVAGKLKVGTITSNEMGEILDANVTTAKIADSNVTLAKLSLPSGFPVQVDQAVKTDTQSFTSNASDWEDITDLSITLTRAFASASGKVLIQGVVNTDTNNGSYGVAIRIQRDGVTIGVGDADGVRQRATSHGAHGSGNGAFPIAINFLDTSPGSNATVTYKLQARSANTVTNYINRDDKDTNDGNLTYRTISTLTVTELAP